ncbi:hypothetical protein THASP1DRAFT_7852, partial [Thamnocephalis sphaerospora]
WFADYHTYEEIVDWTRKLASRHANLVQLTPSIGRTHEGRDIPLLRITAPGDPSPRRRVWLQALQHAREWISGTTLQYVAQKLVEGYAAGNSRVVRLLGQVEFVMIPVANPDGYVYTWTTDRLWRKNRRDNKDGSFGVDLASNRNWPDHWNVDGASTEPLAIDYAGTAPGSEPEVQALMRAYLNTPNVVSVLDMHAYSQLLLRPYGWDDLRDPEEQQYVRLSDELASTIEQRRGSHYVSQRSYDLYPAAGIASDCDVDRQQRPYSLTIELSPADTDVQGNAGFILPPEEIRQVGEDI